MTVIVMCSLEFPFKILIDKMVNLRDFLKKNDLCTGPVLVTQQGGRLMKAVWFIKKARLVSEHISFPVHSNQLPFSLLISTWSKFLHNIFLIDQIQCTIRPLYCRWGKVERPTIQLTQKSL